MIDFRSRMLLTLLVHSLHFSVVHGGFKDDKPDVVCGYLEKDGYKTEGYKLLGGDDYFACSPYKQFGKGMPPNNLAYYIDGKKTFVTNVYLTLNVNNKSEAKKAHAELLKVSDKLAKKATGEAVPKEARLAIIGGKEGEWKSGGFTFKVIKVDFTGTIKGYNLTFRIE